MSSDRCHRNNEYRRIDLPDPTSPRAARLNRRNAAKTIVAWILPTSAIVAIIEVVVGVPPLILFVLAIGGVTTSIGPWWGLLSLFAATLATDFFFVHPTLTLSLDQTVMNLGLKYFFGGVVAYCVYRYTRRASGLNTV